MGASDAFLEAVKTRRSNYTLSSETTIPDSKVVEIVQTAIKHAPSTYNVQSARAVVLFGESHHKFWDIATSHISALPMDENAKKYLTSRLSGFRGAHGTVLFFEDQAALDTLGTKNAMVQPMLTEFSDHSSGMHQFIVWTALTAEGLGCNLQHYNFLPAITAETLSAFGLPETWKLKAQLVFGKPTAPPLERSYLPIEERVLVKE
ncbi:putative nitroreductase [Exophiala dermatitidis]|uniref:Nitroreductase domain-containing protein n=2 Tax=Exophiala dermatitidis TaxID=5970 RepID=H6C4G6_EXODN|nr:uncharacterized protein HMPREF1120_05668 [Exophiala dermatitidis NIH/UT8656]KAJ4516149.1 putative nitroreductase [Exophiala dermatitidis]EHY57639.1 hypothetical protein HMPREF1120_05668 [Exophiala dermatitidis NIH/UT8656]KAJ4518445.1 putative nitroreductase [Exophiala dermatitidis]KAJ4533939.1 putative nitroreductase [Exophiala dermatitidis]KAJ4550096.1 putative nitroreductase [Exophiala dermatitidis]